MKFKRLFVAGLTSFLVIFSLCFAFGAETTEEETAETTLSEAENTSDGLVKSESYFLSVDEYYKFENAVQSVPNTRAFRDTSESDEYKYYKLLNSKSKAVYDNIESYLNYKNINLVTVNNSEYYADVFKTDDLSSYEITTDDYSSVINDAYQAFFLDNPKESWTNSLMYSIYTKESIISNIEFYFISYGTAAEIAGYMNEFEDLESGIISGASSYTTTHDKIKYIHDELCYKTTYGYYGEEPISDLNKLFSHSIFGIPVNGVAVCQGYAKTFQAICDDMGIPCIYQSGASKTGGVGHGWNLVKMDDDLWYYFDVTWDDNYYDQIGDLYYEYFLRGEKAFSASEHSDYTYENSLGLDIADASYPTSTRPPTEITRQTLFPTPQVLYAYFSP